MMNERTKMWNKDKIIICERKINISYIQNETKLVYNKRT